MTASNPPKFGRLRDDFLGMRGGQGVPSRAGTSENWPSRVKIVEAINDLEDGKKEIIDGCLVPATQPVPAKKRRKARQKATTPKMSPKRYQKLCAGEPQPWPLLTIVAALMQLRPEVIAESCEEKPPRIGAEPPWWRKSWEAIFRVIGRLFLQIFSPPELANCKGDEDVLEAARMALEWMGRQTQEGKEDGKLTEIEAIALGERCIQRTLKEMVAHYGALAGFNDNCIRFIVVTDQKGIQKRVGLTILAPLTEMSYMQFRQGKIDPADLRHSDFHARSSFILWLAVMECRPGDFTDRTAIADAQIATLLCQLAALSRRGKRGYHSISLCGAPESKRRLLAHSFLPTGTFTPGGLEIMELASAPPTETRSDEELQRYKTAYDQSTKFFFIASVIGIAMRLNARGRR